MQLDQPPELWPDGQRWVSNAIIFMLNADYSVPLAISDWCPEYRINRVLDNWLWCCVGERCREF